MGRKRKEKPVEKPVEVVPKTNSDKVRNALKRMHPKQVASIDAGDDFYLCNVFMCNDADRETVAKELGLEPSKCSLCDCGQNGGECSFFSFPLNNCRNGILRWLAKEV